MSITNNGFIKSKNDIIEEVYSDPSYNKVLNLICNKKLYRDDLKQELYIILLGMEEVLIVDLYYQGSLIKWVYRILEKQWRSKSSPFYKKYRSPINNSLYHQEYMDDIEDSINDIEYLDNFKLLDYVKESKILTWSEWELFVFYYKLDSSFMDEIIDKRSYSKIANEFSLSVSTVKKTFNSIRYKIIKKLKSDPLYCDYVDEEYEKNIINRK